MVMFTGLWKANHHRRSGDGDDQQENYPTLRNPTTKPTCSHLPPKENACNGGNDESTIDDALVFVDQEERKPESQSSTTTTSSSRKRLRLGNLKPTTYVSSVLFGGLWARSESQRRNNRQSVSHSKYPQYGAVSLSDDDMETLQREGVEDGLLLQHQGHNGGEQQHDDDDDDDESDFPSLTSVFSPDEVDWGVLQWCLFYLSAYLVVAVIAYCFVFEHWTVIDSVYFAVSTFTTVGYGDLQPETTAGQLFTIAFAVYGVIVLGIFIGIFGHAISEGQAHTMRKLKTGRQRKLIKLLFQSTKKMDAAREIRQEGLFQQDSLIQDVVYVLRAELPSILLVFFLAFILGIREGWSLTSTAYFAIMSASTTGYGDYTPSTQTDKLYCVFFLPISVAVFGEVLGRIASVYITRRTRQAEQNFLRRSMTKFDLRQMDTDHDGMVSMEEWLSFMLLSLQKVDANFLDDLKLIFHELDSNGNGFLDKGDLIAIHKIPQWKQIQALSKEQ